MMLGSMGADDGLEGEGGWPDQSSKVQAVVSFAGPTDLAADDLPPPALGPVKGLLGGSASEKPDLAEKASPLTYASEGDAPMLLLHGTKDNIVPYSQAVKMAEALTEAGVPGRIELILGAGHGWGGADAKRSMEQTFEFFDRYLTPDP
jgi:dipeptidyl aminopeptidase/acylaminoacyl peptidase